MSRLTLELSPAMKRVADKLTVACSEWDFSCGVSPNGDEFITVKTGASIRNPLIVICLSCGMIGVGLRSQFADSSECGFSVRENDNQAVDRVFAFACGVMFGLEW